MGVITYPATPYHKLKRQQLLTLAYALEEMRDRALERLNGRMLKTAEELDALPVNAVVVDVNGTPRTKRHGNDHLGAGWTNAGNSPLKSNELADGRPMRLVWHPYWERPSDERS